MDFDLERFIQAQHETYDTALAEVRAGRKRTHWMWFIFPQLKVLGSSPTANYYGLRDLGHATAYLAHPELGPRLVEIASVLLEHHDLSAREIMGSPDDLKLRSSMTLFAAVPGSPRVFDDVLARYFGSRDARTLDLLRAENDKTKC